MLSRQYTEAKAATSRRTPNFALCPLSFSFGSSVTDHIRQHAVSAGHTAAQLAIPNHTGVD